MEKSTQAILGGLFTLIIVGVAILTALGKETGDYIAFLGGVMLPAIIALFARDEARKGRKASERAEDNAAVAVENSAKAVHNTNGRMSELLQIIQANGGDIPPGYEDVMSPEQAAVTTVRS